MPRGNLGLKLPQEEGIAGWSRATPLPRVPAILLALAALLVSCGERYSFASCSANLVEGRDDRTSVTFALNHRPIKLELYLRVEGGKAVVELDHPDGRTTESFEVLGPGIREIRKEYRKEPGSWGLRVSALGGNVSYWAALHDRKKYEGPDEDARRLVDRTR